MSASVRLLSAIGWLALVAAHAHAQCEEQHLRNPNTGANEEFGRSIEISGDVMVVGALEKKFLSVTLAGAYVFLRDKGGTPSDPVDDRWRFHQELVPAGLLEDDAYGRAVAFTEDRIVVSATVKNGGSGAVIEFIRDQMGTPGEAIDDVWTEHGEVVAPVALPARNFGTIVEMQNDLLLVNAFGAAGPVTKTDGAAYIYGLDDSGTPNDLSDDSWTFLESFVADQIAEVDIRTYSAIALSDDYLFLSERGSADAGIAGGIVTVYRRDRSGTPTDASDDTFAEVQVLTGSDAADGDLFGNSISVDQDLLLVGAPGRLAQKGGVYSFYLDTAGTPGDPSDDVWTEASILDSAYGPLAASSFGVTVELDGGTALIAEANQLGTNLGPRFSVNHLDDGGTPSIFGDDFWVRDSEVGLLDSFVIVGSAGYGFAVALDGRLFAVGAPLSTQGGFGGVLCYNLDTQLCAPRSDISLSSGGTHDMNFNHGVQLPNKMVAVLGSATGTSPGLDFGGGLVLPLIHDPYFKLTLNQPNFSLFSGYRSVLDGVGRGRASLEVPEMSDPSLAGATLWHAVLTYTPGGVVTSTSNAVALQLIP